MFDDNNFDELEYLNFDPNFNLTIGDKIKIVLGPNGIGKSSIFNNIKNRFPNYKYIDYGKIEQSVINKKDEIIIGASIGRIKMLENTKKSIIDQIDIKGNLRKVNITNKSSAKNISTRLDEIRNKILEPILEFSGENLNCLFAIEENYKDFLNKNINKLVTACHEETNLENIKNNLKIHFLKEIDNFLTDDEKCCPVCGTVKEMNIKTIVRNKIAEIREINDELLKEFTNTNSNLSPEEIKDNFENLKNIISNNNITITNVENYLLCGGSSEKCELILNSKEELNRVETELIELENSKTEFYNNLKEQYDIVISTFKFQLDVPEENIYFDDNNKLIKIKLPRKIEEYSTGEIHLFTFIICILEFVSSDIDKLIIDDPLSSYDIPNQYKIIYEITLAHRSDKKILIFTHNIDTINIANTQYSGLFEYENIEQSSNILYLNDINIQTCNNVISKEEILTNVDVTNEKVKYFNLLFKKETWDDTNSNHLIFHYDRNFTTTIEDKEYNNDYLANLIDNFDEHTLHNINYAQNCLNKVIYLAAIRVWIEKQFYNNSPDDQNLHGKQLGEKIKYMFNNNRWHGSARINRRYLMSKKVMLNQNIHITSQNMPFYFALNLSLDNITKEIIDIKNHFMI